MAPMGFQWFSLQDRRPAALQAGIEVVAPIIEAFIDEQRARFGLLLSDVALVGFSQGTMTSLYTAPRLPDPIAGVLGYSGALFGAEEILANPENFQTPPVRLIHGEADDVVDVAAYYQARETLKQAGFAVSGHTTPHLPHSIDEDGIMSGAQFLAQIFA